MDDSTPPEESWSFSDNESEERNYNYADSNIEIFKQSKNIYYQEENKEHHSTQNEKETEDKATDFDGYSKR